MRRRSANFPRDRCKPGRKQPKKPTVYLLDVGIFCKRRLLPKRNHLASNEGRGRRRGSNRIKFSEAKRRIGEDSSSIELSFATWLETTLTDPSVMRNNENFLTLQKKNCQPLCCDIAKKNCHFLVESNCNLSNATLILLIIQ